MARTELRLIPESTEKLMVSVRGELTLGEWRKVLEILGTVADKDKYYQPLYDLKKSIQTCVDTFDRTYNAYVKDGEHV